MDRPTINAHRGGTRQAATVVSALRHRPTLPRRKVLAIRSFRQTLAQHSTEPRWRPAQWPRVISTPTRSLTLSQTLSVRDRRCHATPTVALTPGAGARQVRKGVNGTRCSATQRGRSPTALALPRSGRPGLARTGSPESLADQECSETQPRCRECGRSYNDGRTCDHPTAESAADSSKAGGDPCSTEPCRPSGADGCDAADRARPRASNRGHAAVLPGLTILVGETVVVTQYVMRNSDRASGVRVPPPAQRHSARPLSRHFERVLHEPARAAMDGSAPAPRGCGRRVTRLASGPRT